MPEKKPRMIRHERKHFGAQLPQRTDFDVAETSTVGLILVNPLRVLDLGTPDTPGGVVFEGVARIPGLGAQLDGETRARLTFGNNASVIAFNSGESVLEVEIVDCDDWLVTADLVVNHTVFMGGTIERDAKSVIAASVNVVTLEARDADINGDLNLVNGKSTIIYKFEQGVEFTGTAEVGSTAKLPDPDVSANVKNSAEFKAFRRSTVTAENAEVAAASATFFKSVTKRVELRCGVNRFTTRSNMLLANSCADAQQLGFFESSKFVGNEVKCSINTDVKIQNLDSRKRRVLFGGLRTVGNSNDTVFVPPQKPVPGVRTQCNIVKTAFSGAPEELLVDATAIPDSRTAPAIPRRLGTITIIGTNTPVEFRIASSAPEVVGVERETVAVDPRASLTELPLIAVAPGKATVSVTSESIGFDQQSTVSVLAYDDIPPTVAAPPVETSEGGLAVVRLVRSVPLALRGDIEARIQSVDPEIATVLTPTVAFTGQSLSTLFRVAGRSAGRTDLLVRTGDETEDVRIPVGVVNRSSVRLAGPRSLDLVLGGQERLVFTLTHAQAEEVALTIDGSAVRFLRMSPKDLKFAPGASAAEVLVAGDRLGSGILEIGSEFGNVLLTVSVRTASRDQPAGDILLPAAESTAVRDPAISITTSGGRSTDCGPGEVMVTEKGGWSADKATARESARKESRRAAQEACRGSCNPAGPCNYLERANRLGSPEERNTDGNITEFRYESTSEGKCQCEGASFGSDF